MKETSIPISTEHKWHGLSMWMWRMSQSFTPEIVFLQTRRDLPNRCAERLACGLAAGDNTGSLTLISVLRWSTKLKRSWRGEEQWVAVPQALRFRDHFLCAVRPVKTTASWFRRGTL